LIVVIIDLGSERLRHRFIGQMSGGTA